MIPTTPGGWIFWGMWCSFWVVMIWIEVVKRREL